MVVVSDVEGTLTTGATWRAFGEYLMKYRSALAYRWFFATHLPGAVLVKLGVIDEQDYKVKWLVDLLRLFESADEGQVRHMVAAVGGDLWSKRRADVIAELAAHREAGRRVILVSGTYQPLVEDFASRIGAEAVGSPLEWADERLTGRIAGVVSVRGEKVERLMSMLNGAPVVAAYGDTDSDVPMLALAEQPTAVCPSPALRKIAIERGWRILDGNPKA